MRICPDTGGSAEDAPDTTAAHTRRDRRWAQGNLQHLRLIGASGLHRGQPLHLLAGIQSYLSAPIWLALVVCWALARCMPGQSVSGLGGHAGCCWCRNWPGWRACGGRWHGAPVCNSGFAAELACQP